MQPIKFLKAFVIFVLLLAANMLFLSPTTDATFRNAFTIPLIVTVVYYFWAGDSTIESPPNL